MFRVTPPDGIPVDDLFESVEDAMWELRFYMYIPDHMWHTALDKEQEGETKFHFMFSGTVGHIEAVLH